MDPLAAENGPVAGAESAAAAGRAGEAVCASGDGMPLPSGAGPAELSLGLAGQSGR